MKKYAPFIVFGVIVVMVISLFLSLASSQHMITIEKGNTKRVPLKMQPNKYQDSYCGMVIESLDYASQVIAPDGRTWFFHDHGDFVEWLKDKPFKENVVIWVRSLDTHKWIDGKKAFYSLTDDSPMGYGFGAYEHKQPKFVDYKTMRLRMLRGETLKNPLIRKQLLQN